jgi:hypothetical protein
MKKTIAKASRTFSGEVAGYSKRHRFIITAEAEHLSGNSQGHFSVTAEVPNLRGTDIERGGCMHREILLAWPAVKPIVDLHLSDMDGAPMYAEANGWYQMAGALGGAGEEYHAGNSERQIYRADGSFEAYRKPTPDECLQSVADHLRISLDDARNLRDVCQQKHAETIEAGKTRTDEFTWEALQKHARKAARTMFAAFVRCQAERWQAEAKAALQLIQSLGHGIATDEENRAALKRQRAAEKEVKTNTLAGLPVPPKGSPFKLSHVAEIILPHPFHITDKHMARSRGTINPDAAPCGYPGCQLTSKQHEAQKTLFIVVQDNSDLNAIPGLHAYLSTHKAAFEAAGVQGFAFPTEKE